MPSNKAKNFYIGKEPGGRLNCAQSIIGAFKDHFNLKYEELRKYQSYGGGNAPGGECGAYAAAKDLLAKTHPEKLPDFEAFFKDVAGSLTCKEIRSIKKLSCIGCLDKAEEYLNQTFN
ncbi:MAG: C-GCAxxG-C-C family protein [Candidatus Saganbacteria bacterium]|nr:C-GCAxxG-C-C family protein [Candidatus Saganbacteria bacterium]